MPIGPTKPILIIEDSPEDYETIIRAFKKADIHNPTYHCSDGDEALDFLYHHGQFEESSSPRPGIILLDLNLPGTDGREVLSEIKKNKSLKTIPIVVLTTSSNEVDIENCYLEGVNSYVTKPINFSKFIDAILRFKQFWFDTATLPKGEVTSQ